MVGRVRLRLRTADGRHRKPADATRLHMRLDRRDGVKDHRGAPAEQVRMRRGAAAVWHVQHGFDSGHAPEQFGRHVQRAALSARGERGLVRVGLDPGNQLLDVGRWNGRVHGEQQGHDVGEDDRLEIRHRVIGQLLEDELVGRVARSHDHEVVAVGRTLGDKIGSEIVRSARLVLDDHRLAHGHGHLVGDEPRDGVDGATRGGRHDNPDRPRGIGLRTRAASDRRKRHCDRNGRNAMGPAHDALPVLLFAIPRMTGDWHER